MDMDSKRVEKLITKALLKEISEGEQCELDEWLDASEQNRSFFESLHSEAYLKKAVGDHNRALRDAGWKQIKRKTIEVRSRKIRWQVSRIAAAIIFPFVLGGFIWYMMGSVEKSSGLPFVSQEIKVGGSKAVVTLSTGERVTLFGDTTVCVNDGLSTMINQQDTLNFMKNNDVVVAENSYTVIEIPRGGEYVVRLEDGTVVYLNSESELRIPVHFGSEERLVWLKGEAYFNVEHESKRRFIVRTDRADVSVLGTEFGVRAYADEKEFLTTLVKGSVEVKSENNVHRIEPGEQAKVDNAGSIAVAKVNTDEFVAWKLGRIVFTDARLEDIMNELQRWYDFNVFYTNSELKELRFSMDIVKYKEVSEIFDLMEKIRRVSFEVNGNNVILK